MVDNRLELWYITVMIIRLLNYTIKQLTRYKEYLINQSIPKKVTAEEWAKGYKKWNSKKW